ncbi:hypothetical protein [Flavihumibacter petaseus]|uniref:Uncharacterized protein n=1 Tax=Flavihumibacter petaseus NBRC 106054 TaxID=1220578 RepID=A0A0E9MXI4_9BACT|nr:hypothetical protein [Flavihumibacter petaseus]GAO42324.1 hypothetical protein FPE01S_01_13380 [Flavihumibacter petaseus NBRC 106054]
MKEYISALSNGTKDSEVKKWMENVLKLKMKERDVLLSSLRFTLDQDDLIRKIKEKIKSSIVVRNNHDDVYHSLHSNIRTYFYKTIKAGKKIQITFDEYKRLFGSCYFTGANGKLPIRRVAVAIPSEPTKLRFIKMLIDINDLDDSKEDEIIEHTTNMLLLLNHLEEWEKSGYIGPAVRQVFDNESILKWRNIFKESTRAVEKLVKGGRKIEEIDADIIEGALKCLDTIRREVLTIEDTMLDTALSNGQFYLLSENEQIGWRYDWKS